ncbi:cholesterol 25-hydroxylase-like protein 2 [Chanos chanos]|uniref:Cholesterol 25-hydroxylase-like protein 2 n=1 Tax=Chanos chanos TaxID=29144 RepID=A0A6J2UVQ8_CHACN|nr:cholesterol 25-hydroxylase-like protein 2 [Chanos chanos]
MESLNTIAFTERRCGNDVSKIMTHTALPGQPLLQPVWDYLRDNYPDALRSPLLSVFLSVSTYFLSCLFFSALDAISTVSPIVNQYRIHRERPVKSTDINRAVGLTLYHQIVLVLPASVAQWWWRPPLLLEDSAPSMWDLISGVLACFLLFDFQYFLWHLLHHSSRWLYATFHAIHHEYSRPFCWVTQHMSAWEIVSVGLWTTFDPHLLGCHTLTGYTFMVLNVWASVDDHSGYDFPWALHRLVPFGLWGGALKHDFHHQKPGTNFAPYFSHWDWLCGTDADLEKRRE